MPGPCDRRCHDSNSSAGPALKTCDDLPLARGSSPTGTGRGRMGTLICTVSSRDLCLGSTASPWLEAHASDGHAAAAAPDDATTCLTQCISQGPLARSRPQSPGNARPVVRTTPARAKTCCLDFCRCSSRLYQRCGQREQRRDVSPPREELGPVASQPRKGSQGDHAVQRRVETESVTPAPRKSSTAQHQEQREAK
jgi:hypothetical protein